jgi:conjugal transfer pilus assembly protein TraW
VTRALIVLAGLFFAIPASARDYGQQGTVWSIAEPDLLQQIHARLMQLERTGETARLNEELRRRTVARVNRPMPVPGLIQASVNRAWVFDPTITVERDIADDKGRVIIAAGTRVNPLDTVPLRAPLVFLDGDEPDQVAWALARFGRTSAKFILVKGAPLELMKARQRRFYFDQGGTLVKRFDIRAVPASVEQQGRVLRITEEPVKPRERASS